MRAGAVVVMLRGSTEGFLDDVERAVDDGINAYKVGVMICSPF
jgi:chaperonin GroEL (HSP60 family)